MAIIDPWQYIMEWWQDYQADPRSNSTKIESGLKRQQIPSDNPPPNVDQATKANLQTGSCQYWVKGLPCVCDHWDSDKRECTFSVDNDKANMPTGYGMGGCDALGRRAWCSEYTTSEEFDANKYVCVLPCLEKSGSGKIIKTETTLSIEPWLPEDIKGYNPDDKNVGQCDGSGMGRGTEGIGILFVEDLYLLPPVCKHYKPHQLGFGAVLPRPYHGKPPSTVWKQGQTYVPKDLDELHDGSIADPLVMMDKRLPFSFLVYNQRAQFQKCAHWDSDIGGIFYFDDYGADPSYFQIAINQDAESYCMKAREGDGIVLPYATINQDAVDIPWVLYNVWSHAGSIVCNGAKPECPCYTGKWIYCTDKNMQDGMRITADQLFELRFWASNWSSQEEYDKYYAKKPGPTVDGHADITTADLYTFTKWFKGGFLADDSIMQGKKHHMCMPAPLQHRIFSRDMYVTIDAVVYPKAGENEGTTTNDTVSYPTLVRELDAADDLHPDILVIYPYNTINPWDEYPCDESDRPRHCFLNHNIMYGSPKIVVVGQCTRNKKVWAINASTLYGNSFGGGTSGPFSYMLKYLRSQLIPRYSYFSFCRDLEEVIKDAESTYTDSIISGIADEYGFFRLDGLELLSEGRNEIFVFCQFASGDFPQYNYRHRTVISRYFGGLITQTKFTHYPGQGGPDPETGEETDGYENTMPVYYTPPADMTGIVKIVNGLVSNVFSVFSHYQYGLSGDVAYYAYCINAYTETDDDVQEWVQIGPTGYIWAEISDIRISYLFPFIVEEAYISPRPTYDAEGNASYSASLCGTDADGYDNVGIKLEPIPFEDSMRKTAPPNAVLLKSSVRPKDFFNTDWQLSIKYTFAILENKIGETPIFPTGFSGMNKFVSPGYKIQHTENRPYFDIFKIGGDKSTGSAAVMAYIVDVETERIQAAAATKMLFLGHQLTCRGVDIEYEYGIDVAAYVLVPKTGFFTWIGPPFLVGDPLTTATHNRHTRSAKCGDHDCTPGNCIGPMWFPYNDCTTIDYYDMVNPAASCTMPISEGADQLKVMGRAAWRYCTAEEFNCWVDVGGNWAAACGTSFTYYYSRTRAAYVFGNETGQHGSANTMEFTGKVRKMGQVLKAFYLASGWSLPPFGNSGREMVERWVIRDYAAFYDLSLPESPIPRSEYMPMVLDREDLAADIDCFRFPGISSHPNLREPFFHRSMLSNYLADWLQESVEGGRYEFSEIIELQYHGNCMYPWPTRLGRYSFEVIRYKFTDRRIAWVWPEYWKDIDRTLGSDSIPFKFVILERPDYYYDLDKQEHRLIVGEGDHTIFFRPPKKDETGGTSYAAISLDGVHWRYFDIMYESYSEGYADWKDESAEGTVGGSGGESSEPAEGGEGGEGGGAGGDGGSIYENANNGKEDNGKPGQNPIWIHDFDTIFDTEASGGIDDDRKAFLGFDDLGIKVYGYYNRGLIAKIPKSRLNKLPTSMDSLGSGQVVSGNLNYGDVTYSNVVLHWDSSDLSDITPTRVVITGRWGITGSYSDGSEKLLCLPGVECGESQDAPGGSGVPEFPQSIYSQLPRSAHLARLSTGREGVSKFTTTVDLNTYPSRIAKPPAYFQVQLSRFGSEGVIIDSVTLYGEYYIDSQEDIRVWERRYKISSATGNFSNNADGPESEDFRSYDESLKNAGQYFPTRNTKALEDGGTAVSKMTMISSEKYFGQEENEEIETTYDTLRTVEKEEQKKLYEKAYRLDSYDTLNLNGFYPPDIEYFLTKVIKKGSMRPGNCSLTDIKIYWDDLAIKKAFSQEGTFFQPGGHWFNWSADYTEMRCYLFGPIKVVYSVDVIHNKHSTGGSTGRGEEAAYSAGESYVGWTRLNYYEGRYWNAKSLGQSDYGTSTDIMTRSIMYSSPAQIMP